MVIDQEANYHLPVVDTLYRFGAGVDTNNNNLLETVFSTRAVVDFSPCGRKMGLDFPVLTGAEDIVRFLGTSADAQITSHMITNGRVHLTGHGAELQALVDATHISRADSSRKCQMMNWYHAELIQSEDRWRICRLTIDNVWFTGSPEVLLGR